MAKRILIGLAALVALALAVAIWRFNAAPAGEPLSGQTRADFVRSAHEGCAKRQRENDPDIDAGLVDRFCGCYAEGLAKRVTTADLDRLKSLQTADIQSDMRAKMDDADRVCAAEVEDGEK